MWSALGLYPIAGTDRYALGAPLFPRARVRLPGGGTLVIERAATGGPVRLDGVELAGPEVRHRDLAAGGTLRFE